MFSRIFIYRPVLALVISIFIALIGAISIPVLPIENTPDITPPTVEVTTSYPGASAPVIAEKVAVPIEQEVNGVDDMIYMQSKSSDDGSMSLTVTFEIGTDIDMASVLVQNRVAIAEPKLPEETKRQGITTKKKSSNMVLMVNFDLVIARARRDLHQQLHQLEHQRSARSHLGRRQRTSDGREGLRDAYLARPRAPQSPRVDDERCRRRHPRAERPSGDRPRSARRRRPWGSTFNTP